MKTLPDWFLTEHTPCDPENLPEYHLTQWNKMDANLRNYVLEAISHGCALTYTRPAANSLDIAVAATGPAGEELAFIQLIMNDPRDETFMFYKQDERAQQANRTDECRGIDIWNTDALVEKAFVCDSCGKIATSLDQLEFYPFAGLGCPECAERGREYFNRNQLWR